MDFSSEEKQRAVWKGSSPAGCLHIDAEEYCHLHCWINHSRHCCFMAGATSQKEAWQHHCRGLQNDTALITEEGEEGEEGGCRGGFWEAVGTAFRFWYCHTHALAHITLLYSCGSHWCYCLVWLIRTGSDGKTAGCLGSLSAVVLPLLFQHGRVDSVSISVISVFTFIVCILCREHREESDY